MEFIAHNFQYKNYEICSIALINIRENNEQWKCYGVEEMDYYLSKEFEYKNSFYDLVEECKNTFIINEYLKYNSWINFKTKEDRDIFVEKINSILIMKKLVQ